MPPLRGEGCIVVGSREPEQLDKFHQSHFFYTIHYQNEPRLAQNEPGLAHFEPDEIFFYSVERLSKEINYVKLC